MTEHDPGKKRVEDKSLLEILTDYTVLAKTFHTRFNYTEQQEPPYEDYRRVKGGATLSGIAQNVFTRKKESKRSVVLIAGSLSEGKSTLFDKLKGQIQIGFEANEVAVCTAEQGLSDAMKAIGSHHKSGEYTVDEYHLGSQYLEADILEALFNEQKKVVIIETPATSGLQVPGREKPLGMDRGTSAIRNIFGPDSEWGDRFRNMLVGAIGLTNRDFEIGLRRRIDKDKRGEIPERGGTGNSTEKAEKEIPELMTNDMILPFLFGIPDWVIHYYPYFNRREVQLARLEWIFSEYFQFPKKIMFIGDVKFPPKERQPSVLPNS